MFWAVFCPSQGWIHKEFIVPQFVSQYGMLIVLVIAMVGIMWFQSRNMKKRQNELKSFHDSLKPGVEVITIGGGVLSVSGLDT